MLSYPPGGIRVTRLSSPPRPRVFCAQCKCTAPQQTQMDRPPPGKCSKESAQLSYASCPPPGSWCDVPPLPPGCDYRPPSRFLSKNRKNNSKSNREPKAHRERQGARNQPACIQKSYRAQLQAVRVRSLGGYLGGKQGTTANFRITLNWQR